MDVTESASRGGRLTLARRRVLDRELERLLELPETARRQRLAELAVSHRRCGAWLARLVDVMDDPLETIERPLGRVADHLAAARAGALALPPGTPLGSWRVIEPIGSGGMGVVYRVERADGAFEMTAAAKLIRMRLDVYLEMRLALERQLLARLDHPNIARILDGGTSLDGQPFLVMEWVPGDDLAVHARSMTVTQRLALFKELAAAVAHAHQRGVVHGDIKPANVRIGADGRVRLLDFGVARLVLDEHDSSGQAATALTPTFAAPEQLTGEPASTQSDVWALGALLGWLLMEDAFDRGRLASSADLRAILASRLARSGDLAAIIARACAECPQQRYAGVPELIEDLERHRRLQPVAARPATRRYLLDRFLRRNPVAVRLGLLSGMLLMVGVGGVVWQAHVASLERDRAERQRDLAELQAAKTQRVSEFVVGLFEQADPYLSPGPELTARDLVEQGRARVAALDEAPRVQAEMLQVLARVHRSLADHRTAQDLSGEALDILQSLPDVSDDALADAWTLYAGTLASMGRYGEAEHAHRQALALTDPADAAALAARLNNLGLAAFSLGRMSDAEGLMRTALVLRETLQPEGADTAASYNNLALVLAAQDRRDEAEPLYRRALDIRRRVLGPEHPTTTYSLTNLATLLSQLARWDEARQAYLEALALRRQIFGNEHPAVASVLYQIGWLQSRLGNFADARPYLEEALAIRERVLGPDHPSTAVVLNAAAGVVRELGELALAERWLQRALAIYRDAYGESHHDIALVLANLGLTLAEAGELAAAEELLEQALAMNRRELGSAHRHVADNLGSLARVQAEQGRHASAAESALAAVELMRTLGVPEAYPEMLALKPLLADPGQGTSRAESIREPRH